MNDLQQFLGHLVHALEAEGRYGTAHVYRSTLHAFAAYWHRRHGGAMPLRAVFRTVVLRGFEHELQGRLLRPNTISTYMRMLRAVYHRALRQGLTAYVRGLFDGVYTGTRADAKRALAPRLMARLLPQPGTACRREQLWFALLFVLRGMPFVDLAHLRKCDLRDGTISYRRRKTGTPLSVRLTPEAATLLRRCADPRPGSPYLLDILARRLPPAEPGTRADDSSNYLGLTALECSGTELPDYWRALAALRQESIVYTWNYFISDEGAVSLQLPETETAAQRRADLFGFLLRDAYASRYLEGELY